MAESRPSIRDTIKNGRFTTRNINPIPQIRRTDSSSTIDSKHSNPSTGTFTPGYNQHIAREGDVLLMPLDLGIEGVEPDCYLAATPAIITYTLGRGYSTVRMEEIDLPHRDLPTIEEMPSPKETDAEIAHDEFGFPIATPPPNFEPFSLSYYENQHYSDDPSSLQNTNTISHSSQAAQPPQSMNAIASDGHNEMEKRVPVTSSPPWTLKTPPPPRQLASHRPTEKLGMSTSVAAWPLSDEANSTVRMNHDAAIYSPQSEFSPGATTLQGTPRWKELQELKSRFSWYDAEEMRRTWLQRWFHDWWLLELICLFLSGAFMAVICVLGWRYDGTEIPEAWTFGITLNALISVLAAFSRVSILFPAAEALGQILWYFSSKDSQRREDFEITDEARQGPLGSIKLLARTKRITWGSSVGAMLLLALPMDFFFQQLIHYPTEWLPSTSGNGTMSRSVQYSPQLTTYTINTTTILYPEPVLESSMFSFVIGNGQDVPLGFDCPTNNCTYPPFWTLALESQCVEMPSLLTLGCETGPGQWTPSATTSPSLNGTYVSGTSCGWYVEGVDPNGPGTLPILMSGYATALDGSKQEALVGRLLPLRDIFTKQLTLGDFQSYNFQNITYPVVDFLVSSTPGGSAGAYNNTAPVLHECVVYWVAQKLNMTVFEGKANGTVLDTKMLDYGGNTSLPAYANNKFLGNYSMTLPDLQNPNTLFSVDNYAARRVGMVLEEVAASAWYSINDTSPLQVKWLWSAVPPKITPAPTGSGGWLSEVGSSLSSYLARMVTSMNHVIWQSENAKTQTSDVLGGQAWRQAVVVRFIWQWIAVPAGVLFLTTMFILATIIRDSGNNSGLGVWRTAAVTVNVKRNRLQKKRVPKNRF